MTGPAGRRRRADTDYHVPTADDWAAAIANLQDALLQARDDLSRARWALTVAWVCAVFMGLCVLALLFLRH